MIELFSHITYEILAGFAGECQYATGAQIMAVLDNPRLKLSLRYNDSYRLYEIYVRTEKGSQYIACFDEVRQ